MMWPNHNAFRIFRARPVPYGTTESPMALQSKGIVSSSPATESARLPWVSVRAIFNPNGCVPSAPSGHNLRRMQNAE